MSREEQTFWHKDDVDGEKDDGEGDDDVDGEEDDDEGDDDDGCDEDVREADIIAIEVSKVYLRTRISRGSWGLEIVLVYNRGTHLYPNNKKYNIQVEVGQSILQLWE